MSGYVNVIVVLSDGATFVHEKMHLDGAMAFIAKNYERVFMVSFLPVAPIAGAPVEQVQVQETNHNVDSDVDFNDEFKSVNINRQQSTMF